MSDSPTPRNWWKLGAIAGACAVAVFVLTALLMSIFERKQEAKNPYVRLVEVTEETTNPVSWGINWAREFNDYKRTVEVSKTTFGGSDGLPPKKPPPSHGSHACLPATHSPSTIAIAAATLTCSRIRNRPAG